MKPERMIEMDRQDALMEAEEAVVNDEDICDKCGHIATRRDPVYAFRVPSTLYDPEEWIFECGKCTKRIREELPY
jgi:hypothetical protein